MIAMGYPEMIDPTPADGLLMSLTGFRKQLREKHGEWVMANA